MPHSTDRTTQGRVSHPPLQNRGGSTWASPFSFLFPWCKPRKYGKMPRRQPERRNPLMATVDGGVLIGRILKEQKIKYMFAVNGGHTFPILANLRDNNIKLIHMRHEQATAYAADGYARVTGTPGVCCVTAGCGLTNAVTGLCVAG